VRVEWKLSTPPPAPHSLGVRITFSHHFHFKFYSRIPIKRIRPVSFWIWIRFQLPHIHGLRPCPPSNWVSNNKLFSIIKNKIKSGGFYTSEKRGEGIPLREADGEKIRLVKDNLWIQRKERRFSNLSAKHTSHDPLISSHPRSHYY